MRKFKSLMLAAIMFLTSNVSANALDTIKINEKNYVLPKYSTFLHPLNLDNGLTDDHITVTYRYSYFVSGINDKGVVLPIFSQKKEYMSPKDPNYNTANEDLKENYNFLRENFRYLKNFEEIPTHAVFETAYEIRSLKLIGVQIRENFFLTKDFFPEDYYVYNSVILDYGTFKKIWENLNPNYESASIPYENREITYKEYKDYFTSVVLESDWPVTPELSKNENNTLPNFNQEELSKDVEGLCLTSIYYTNDNKTNETRTFIATTMQTETDFQIFDYFTGQLIVNLTKDVYNMEYLNQFGIHGKIHYTIGPNLYLSFSSEKYLRAHRNQSMAVNYGPELCPYLEEVRTIGDAIEVYQLLPKETQADYTNFDFSNDPRIEKGKIKELVKDN